MADERYAFTYKFRLCGETYKSGFAGEKIARKSLMLVAIDAFPDKTPPYKFDFHFAEDHIGIADLIGCKKEGSEN